MDKRYNIRHSALGGLWGLGAPLIFSIIASIIIVACGGPEGDLANNTVFLVIVSVLTELSFFLVFHLISRTQKVDFVEASGIKARSPWYIYLILAVVSVACVFLFYPIIDLWQQLLGLLGYSMDQTLPMPLDSAGFVILAIVTLALVPAVCEEFLFRGLILNGLRKYGMWFSVLISALLFSLMHMNLLQLPYTFILGVIFGLVVYYTRNIWLSVIMHFLNNATSILIMAFSQDSGAEFVWWEVLIALGCVAGAVALIYLIIRLLRKKANAVTEPDPEDVQPVLEKGARNRLVLPPIIAGIIFLIIFSLSNFGVI